MEHTDTYLFVFILVLRGTRLSSSCYLITEWFLLGEGFAFDSERAVTAILELAMDEGDPDAVVRASRHINDVSTTTDAFHAALPGDSVISRDRAYDGLGDVRRVRLVPDENEDRAERVRHRSGSTHDGSERVSVVLVPSDQRFFLDGPTGRLRLRSRSARYASARRSPRSRSRPSAARSSLISNPSSA